MKIRFVSEEVGGITAAKTSSSKGQRSRQRDRCDLASFFRIKKVDLYVSRKSRRTSSGQRPIRDPATISIVPGSRRVEVRDSGTGRSSVHASVGRPARPRGPRATIGRATPYTRASLERS